MPPSADSTLPQLLAEVLHPRHFFLAPHLDFVFEHTPAEEISWEVFRGRLLQPEQTRQRATLVAWNIYLVEGAQRSAEPLLSVKWDTAARHLHITRAILCHAWEGYDAGSNVILSRQTTRWIRELVGTLPLAEFPDVDDLRSELAGWLFRAVIGASRLPLTSVEAPLPGFALGELGYFSCRGLDTSPAASTAPGAGMRSWRDLVSRGLHADLSRLEQTKLVELMLRTVSESDLPEAARMFVRRWQEIGQQTAEVTALLRNVFREVSLSPWTHFVERSLAFLQVLVDLGHVTAFDQVDFLSFLLRQTGRHLGAYDLVTFHHRGANYPDALLLDAVLKDYVKCAEQQPRTFLQELNDDEATADRKRIRRRALRQGCLVRHEYQDHLVPEAPTSPGENLRVLPPPHTAVPEEQLLNPLKRTRRLYAGEPLAGLLGPTARLVLGHSFDDLCDPAELRELGTAVFIDRPLSQGKKIGEPDHTPLLAHEAFSPSLAERRLRLLAEMAAVFPGLAQHMTEDAHRLTLRQMPADGLPIQAVLSPDRPVVSLADALRVADDFAVRRTLPSSVEAFLALFDFGPLAARLPLEFLLDEKKAIIVRIPSDQAGEGLLAVYDLQWQKRLELAVNVQGGFAMRAGVEYPRAGLQVAMHSKPTSGNPWEAFPRVATRGLG